MTICAECGKEFSAAEVVSIKGVPVCGNCKPAYLKKLQEGAVTAGGFVYKGFWPRFVAKVVDGLITQLASFAVGAVIGAALASHSGVAVGVSMVVGMAIGFIYPVFFNGKFGATPGKMMIDAKIVNLDGSPIDYSKAAARAFSEILSALILGFGYFMAGWDSQKRTLHDRICGTLVIQK